MLSDIYTQPLRAARPNRRLIRVFLFMGLSMLIAGIAWYIYQEEIRNFRKNIAIEQTHHLENQTTLIREDFKHCTYTLLFLSNQASLHKPFTATASLSALGSDFISFLDSSKLYDQIRLLDIHGMEVFGARYYAGTPSIIPENELKQSGGHEYFVKTIALDANEIYISPMVFTTQHGQGDLSMKPVIQFGMPLFDAQGQKIGMISMSYLAGSMLNKFKKVAGFEGLDVGESMLLNQEGDWLSGPDPKREWGFMFEDSRQSHLDTTAPEAWQRISSQKSGNFVVNGDQYHFTTLDPAEMVASISGINSYRNPLPVLWKVVARYPQTVFSHTIRETRNTIVLFTLAFLLLINSMFWFLARAIARRRQTEDELEKLQTQERERASRLRILGRMSAEIAHELHQPLSAILSYADTCLRLMKKREVEADKMSELLGKISGQADRAGHVVRHVGNFTRSHEMNRASLDLNMLVEETLSLAELDTSKYRVACGVELAKPLPQVFADYLLIQQVLLNLIRNACEAMEEIEQYKRQLTVKTERIENDCIKVSVCDQGPGLKPDELEQMFEPFFTLKKEGMGLGLSVSCSIIENHGGRLWAERLPGKEFVVCFTLPVTGELCNGD
jgi:signal transduction histidine kinase